LSAESTRPGSRRKASALRIIIYFILIAACAFGGAFFASLLTPRGMAGAYAWLIKATAVMLLVLALTNAFLRRDSLAWSDFGATACGLPAAIGWGVAWGALLAGAWLAAVWFLTPFGLEVNTHVLLPHFVAACGATVAMGIAEEVGYRSYGLRALRERGGYWTAALLPTAIFISAHVAGGVPWLAGVLVVGSASVLFAVVMLETNKLPLVVALHATTNFIQDNLLRTSPDSSLFQATFPSKIAENEHIYAWIALALINALATLAVIGWSRRRVERYGKSS
jgi:membrane protease YdiL (CAAX protease family)